MWRRGPRRESVSSDHIDTECECTLLTMTSHSAQIDPAYCKPARRLIVFGQSIQRDEMCRSLGP